MSILLDSHILVWLMDDNPLLTPPAKSIIAAESQVFVSTASIWELSIKTGLGKLRMDIVRLVSLLDLAGISELQISRQHAMAVSSLPLHHRDPFDRMLIAQAVSEHMRLLTADPQLRVYSDLVECI